MRITLLVAATSIFLNSEAFAAFSCSAARQSADQICSSHLLPRLANGQPDSNQISMLMKSAEPLFGSRVHDRLDCSQLYANILSAESKPSVAATNGERSQAKALLPSIQPNSGAQNLHLAVCYSLEQDSSDILSLASGSLHLDAATDKAATLRNLRKSEAQALANACRIAQDACENSCGKSSRLCAQDLHLAAKDKYLKNPSLAPITAQLGPFLSHRSLQHTKNGEQTIGLRSAVATECEGTQAATNIRCICDRSLNPYANPKDPKCPQNGLAGGSLGGGGVSGVVGGAGGAIPPATVASAMRGSDPELSDPDLGGSIVEPVVLGKGSKGTNDGLLHAGSGGSLDPSSSGRVQALGQEAQTNTPQTEINRNVILGQSSKFPNSNSSGLFGAAQTTVNGSSASNLDQRSVNQQSLFNLKKFIKSSPSSTSIETAPANANVFSKLSQTYRREDRLGQWLRGPLIQQRNQTKSF